jgi:quercetin dioxygenase-like cupin family protein
MTTHKQRFIGVLATLGVAATIAGVRIPHATAQTPPVQLIPIGHGSTPDANFKAKSNGPTDVEQDRLIFQAGSSTGWHIHPGPAIVIVTQGALTDYEEDGCKTVLPAGSVLFEPEGKVHNLANETGGLSEILGTLILPAGSPLLIPTPPPAPKVCNDNRKKNDQ